MADMKSTPLRAFVAGMLLLASCTVAAQSFDALLQQADSVHTADPAQFNRLLARLDQSSDRATSAQLMKLRLLHAYQPLLSGDYQASINELKLLLASQPDIDVRFRAGGMLVTNYAAARQFSDGLEMLQRTLLLSEGVKDIATRQQGSLIAAMLYGQVGQYRLTSHFANQVLSNPITARNECIAGELRVEALTNLGEAPPDESIKAAIQRCKTINENIPSGLLVGLLARKWYAEGNLNAAAQLLEENLVNVEATHFPRTIGEVRSLLSEVLLDKGDLEGSERNANAVVVLKAGVANTPPLATAYKVLYQIAERRHDLPTALAYYKKFAEADKGYLNEVKTRELAYQIVRNENTQKNQQIELLNRQNRVLQLQQKVDQQTAQNSRLLMLVSTLLALSLAYWAYRTRRLQTSLRRMAETDALTGICNRHHFTIKSEQSLAQCAKAGEHASLIMFDLDHFKLINDSYGHATGDWVLTRVAADCSAICRQMDHMGRVGGEEFAILLHGCDLKAATRIAEDCRVRLSRIDASGSGYTFPITASFGVSATSMSGYDLDKLCSHADQMLYRAKREGRNRVRSYAPDQPIELKEAAAPDEASPRNDSGIADGEPLGTLSA
jgi:diguanylate cyclase (GGDEF)-like protein